MPKAISLIYGELAVLPYQAETTVSETLEFLTDVMESFDGSEQRLQLRTKARQTLSYTMPHQFAKMAEVFNTEYGAIRKRWAIPVWSEVQYVGTIFEGATSINCNTQYYDFRNESLAIVISCNKWQILDIANVFPDKITLLVDTQAFRGAYLAPVRLGWIANTIARQTNGYTGNSKIDFEVDDTLELIPEIPPQFILRDVYTKPGLLSGGNVESVIGQRLDEVDQELGVVERRTPWENARINVPHRSILNNKKDIFEYRQFLYRRAGKYREFWMPTHEANMRVLSTGLIGNIMDVQSDSYIDYALIRYIIGVQTMDGVWTFLRIMDAVQLNASTVRLSLSKNLNIQAKNIAKVSYLGLYRLDTDRIEINWPGAGLADIEVSTVELSPF